MLSPEDREWLTGQFNLVHQRVTDEAKDRAQADEKLGSSIHHVKEDVVRVSLNEAMIDKHEDKHHNPAKTWGMLAAIAGVVSLFVEGIKMAFKFKGGSQ